MNTFCFIRWPRSRLHGHFYSAPTLKFTDASEPPMGKQRLQWQSLRVGRLYLSFQRDSPLHPTDSIPMDRVHLQNKKSPAENSGLEMEDTDRPLCVCSVFFFCRRGGVTRVFFFAGSGSPVCDLVLTFCIIHNVSQQVGKKVWKLNQREVVGLSSSSGAPLTGKSLICV